MSWLWFAGPLTFILLAVIYSVWPSAEEDRLRRELHLWLNKMLGPLAGHDDAIASRATPRLPASLHAAVGEVTLGSRIADIALVPKLAYLSVRAADAHTSANTFTVACRLEKPGPSFVCRPLPIVDGRLADNDGVRFKDTEFMDHYLVESDDARAVRKWLPKPLRDALLLFPDLWLRVQGRALTLTYHGYADAEMIDELVEVADVLFSDRGAGGAEPLFGDPDVKATYREEPSEVRKRFDEDGDEYEDDEEELGSRQNRITAGVIDGMLFLFGIVLSMAVMGQFAGVRTALLFNSPDLVVTEPWQGGWTTKGFGALVAVESYLVGLITLQAYLALRRGQSIGKLFVGLKIVHVDGKARTFFRTVFLRKWIFALIPLIAAAAQSRPFTARAFFNNIPTKITALAGVAATLLVAGSWMVSKTFAGIHDRMSGTEVVRTAAYRIPALQIEAFGRDPLVRKRLVGGVFALVTFVVLNLVTYKFADAWLLEVHQWR